MCFLPYKYRKILEMLLKLMNGCEIMGARIGSHNYVCLRSHPPPLSLSLSLCVCVCVVCARAVGNTCPLLS